jgi:hypothetical protein
MFPRNLTRHAFLRSGIDTFLPVRPSAMEQPVLRKIFHENAVRWRPGILDAAQ